MTVNVLLGIGGTGAKLVEAMLYLLAAGVAPVDKVVVGLIDQDNSNGNLDRTQSLIANIAALRKSYSESPNIIDWTGEGAPGFLATRIEPLFGKSAHWRPARGDTTNLAQILDKGALGDDERALFDLLFRDAGDPATEEQTMPLGEGYRGRAHVGSAALVAALHDEPAFLARMHDLMKASSKGDDVRIFLAGSIFGGTGAAGFPTIARALNNLRNSGLASGMTANKIHLGGVLMLPYFGFADPASASANVVRDTELLPQSKVALAFYDRLFAHEKIFDRFYMAGWNELLPLGYHNPGAKEQRNPALAPELVGALAAIDFLSADTVRSNDTPLVSARHDTDALGWDDLPGDAALKARVYDRFGRLLRTAAWWRHRVEPAFDNKTFGGLGGVKTGNVKVPWLKLLTREMKDADWQAGTPSARNATTDFFAGLLNWAASIELFKGDALKNFALWDTGAVVAARRPEMPTEPLELHDGAALDEPASNRAFGTILSGRDPARAPRDARAMFDNLRDLPAFGKSAGLGRVMAAVLHAARPLDERA